MNATHAQVRIKPAAHATHLHTPATIVSALDDHSIQMPHATSIAFVHDDGRVDRVTFEELSRRAMTIAWHLLCRAGRGDRAILLYPPGVEFVCAFLGCLYAGVIAVPVAAPRRQGGADRLQRILSDADPRIVLTTSTLRPIVDRALASSLAAPLSTDELPTIADIGRPAGLPSRSEVAFLQYTSGSTGMPKGVIVTHGNLASNLSSIKTACGYTHQSITASWLPLYHDMGLIGNVLAPLFVGFASYLISPASFIQRPARWLEMITRYRATCAGGPNFGWDHAARNVTEEEKRSIDLSSIEIAYNGSEPIRGKTLERFSTAFASCGFRPSAHYPCYGLAEATLYVTGGPVGSGGKSKRFDSERLEAGVVEIVESTWGSRQIVSCGPTWLDTRVEIVDPETRRRAAPDAIGEIWVRGGSVSRGYWNRPEETRETFGAFLADNGDGPFLRTGDLGAIVDGELYVTGRLKDLIIVRGRNIYPHDVEGAVESAVEWVEPNSCAAFALDDDATESVGIVIEATRSIVRAIDVHREQRGAGRISGYPPEVMEIFASVARTIGARFDVTVSSIALVRPGSFPRTTSGKVRRRECRTRMARRDESIVALWTMRGASSNPVEADSNADTNAAHELESIRRAVRQCVVKMIASQHLPMPEGFDDDFDLSTIGLDSIALALLSASIEEETGRVVKDDLLYDCPSVSAASAFLVNAPRRTGERSATMTRTIENAPIVASIDETSTTGVESKLWERYRQLSQRHRTWREKGAYFFHTEITDQDDTHIVGPGGRELLMGSYSYLGLQKHPRIIEAACEATRRFGTGAHGARVLAGTTELHKKLERRLAELLGAEEALVMSSGYVANIATIAALVGPGDVVIGDAWNHASIHDGCAQSGATSLTFAHNDMRELERHLVEAGDAAKLVVVDAVYSMEGDIAPLPEISALCRRHGALLMVDEAHSLGVIGRTGRGIEEHFGMAADTIDVKMGCLSKSLASGGGYIAGRAELIDYLRHTARGYIFSSAVPAATMAAAIESIELLVEEPHRVSRLHELAARYRGELRALGFDTLGSETAIVPVACRSEARALEMTASCRADGLFVVPVFYPAVPMNAARIRTCVLASHSDDDISLAVEIIARAGRKCGIV